MNDDPRKADLGRRLRRIEGQARGVQRMIDAEARCVDVLVQISAMSRALDSVALLLLEHHLRDCVRDAASHGAVVDKQKVAETSAAIARLLRS